ncbi:MAG: NADH-quinone oxidoreductase subunit NuoH [candidate division Zixibacteria bacterium]|nr:NADH-quinone oxidoreductase subunit NuoH [candidate division Zixibacteria bacterium]
MLEIAVIALIKSVVALTVLLLACAWLTYLERRVLAMMQSRIGPNTAGFKGLLTPVADLVKLLFKEDFIPAAAHKPLYLLAPLMAFIPAMLPIAVVPFGDTITLFGREINLVISDFSLGLLFILAVTSLGIYGIIMAGWAPNSKFSLLGGLRSSAQMISYEIGLGMSFIGVIMLAGTLNLVEIVQQQSSILDWYIFKQPLAFLLYLTCAIAETNRAPFDLPEAESELVAGYHTEYSSMRFGLFFVGEYANMVTVAAVATTVFLGGWQGPFLPPILWFIIKCFAFLFFYIWLRGSLPRFRYDQLMKFGWYVLIPLALANILITALVTQL